MQCTTVKASRNRGEQKQFIEEVACCSQPTHKLSPAAKKCIYPVGQKIQ